jgi:outer membrane receptor protein involved in Fe transport
VHVQASVFNIDLQSELIYDQDQGQDQASAPSERQGVEVSAQYRPRPWLELNTDLSLSHARFTASNLAAYGFSGDHIPNAPGFVGSFGALVDHLGPWFGGLEVRSLGAYALVSDNAARDAGYTETNLEVGYRIDDGLKLRMDIFNLFDVRANAAAYFYTSRLAGEPAQGVADHQDHPLEPISARFTITATF